MATVQVSRVMTNVGRMYRLSGGVGGASPLLPSVTSVLSVLDKGGLLNWTVKTALDSVRSDIHQAFIPKEGEPKDSSRLDSKWLEDTLQRAAAAPNKYKDDAADLGTRAHSAINAIICGHRNIDELITPDIEAVVNGFRSWYASSGLRLHSAGDTTVYSRTYGYAGAADAFGETNDGSQLVVCDFKTSNFIHDTYALQLAAYAHALQEMASAGELHLLNMTSAASKPPTAVNTVATPPASEPDGGDNDMIPVLSSHDLSMSLSDSTGQALMPCEPVKGLIAPKKSTSRKSATRVTNGSVIVDADLLGDSIRQLHTSTASQHLPKQVLALVVRIDKHTGKTEVKRVKSLDEAFNAFKAALLLWHAVSHGQLLEQT